MAFFKNRVQTIALGVFSALAASTAAQAATVVFYDFDDAGSFVNAPETVAPEILSASAWTVLGDSAPASATGFGSGSRGIETPPTVLWTADQHLKFTFTIAPGLQLALNGLSFVERFGGPGGGAGPKRAISGWNLLVNGVEQTSGPAVLDQDNTALGINNVDSFRAAILDSPLAVAGLTGTVEVRFTGDSPFGDGTWRIDNFLLEGEFSPVPVPAAAWLFGSALAGLAAWRRRTI